MCVPAHGEARSSPVSAIAVVEDEVRQLAFRRGLDPATLADSRSAARRRSR